MVPSCPKTNFFLLNGEEKEKLSASTENDKEKGREKMEKTEDNQALKSRQGVSRGSSLSPRYAPVLLKEINVLTYLYNT